MEPMRLLVTDTAAQSPRQATAWLIMTLGRANMDTCPKCKSVNVALSGREVWTVKCRACGHGFGGTASFADHEIEVEHEYDVTFQLSSSKQIVSVREIAPEISGFSTADLLRAARANGLKITVPSVAMWRARKYREAAQKIGIETEIKKGA